MGDYEELSQSIRCLFQDIFTQNCKIEDSEMTKEEQDTINSIDIFEVLENLKEITFSLLQFKQEYITSDKAELVKRSEKFETMLQKLEAEVRSHIRVEHQLKLHIETNQSISEDLEIQNNRHLNEIKDLQEKLKKFQGRKEFLEKIQNLEDLIKKKDALIGKLENELNEMKAFAKSDSEKIIRKKSKGKEDAFEGIKQRIGDKSIGLHNIQRVLLDKPGKSCRERNKIIRKSANENDLIKNRVYELKITKLPGKTHTRSTSENIRPRSVGKRAPSR